MDASHATPNSPLVGRKRGRKTSEKPQRVVTVRMHRDLHHLLKKAAHASETSVNVLCQRSIAAAIGEVSGDERHFADVDRQRLLELAEAVAREE